MTLLSPLILLSAWLMDGVLGDPEGWPHPVVLYGKAIAWCERHFNRGSHRMAKGAVVAVTLIVLTFVIVGALLAAARLLHPAVATMLCVLLIFYCLAGTTLIREVKAVFLALDRSLDEGRRQVSRIVGRDTDKLSAQEVRAAALETLAENLSDGVIAPLFWLAVLGVPGMMAYKMVNTLDSMIGYHTDRYRLFGCWAAHIDDAANYIPARLTSLLMILAGSQPRHWWRHLCFVARYGRCHASPNSGYPEAALASILDARFGGTHDYFGQRFEKPYIGHHDRPFTTADVYRAVRVNRHAEWMMVALMILINIFWIWTYNQ